MENETIMFEKNDYSGQTAIVIVSGMRFRVSSLFDMEFFIEIYGDEFALYEVEGVMEQSLGWGFKDGERYVFHSGSTFRSDLNLYVAAAQLVCNIVTEI